MFPTDYQNFMHIVATLKNDVDKYSSIYFYGLLNIGEIIHRPTENEDRNKSQ